MRPSTVLVLLWWLWPPFSSGIFQDGPCPPLRVQPNQQVVDVINVINNADETLLPVVITAPEKRAYSVALGKASFKTSFRFSATFGAGSQCVDTFHLEVKGKFQLGKRFFINSTVIQADNAFVEHDSDSFDLLVYICQNVIDGQKKGHVAHLWILQRASIVTRNSMKMDNLLHKYGDLIENFGIEKRHLLGLSDNDYEFCDEEFFRTGTTAIWYRAVTVMLILIVILTAVGWIVIAIFNATTKLRKVRKFSEK